MLHCNMSSARGGGGGILPMRVGVEQNRVMVQRVGLRWNA